MSVLLFLFITLISMSMNTGGTCRTGSRGVEIWVWGWDKSGIVAVMPLSKDKLKEEKGRFQRDRALYDSYFSAVRQGRGASVYCRDLLPKDPRRTEFQSRACDLLQEISCCYQSRARNLLQKISCCYRGCAMNMTDSEHIEKIIKLRCQLRGEFLDILNNQCLRFGRAQKMLNLYLKHLWVGGYIGTPPHCPFDDNILTELFGAKSYTPWTQMNNIDEYKRWVNKAHQVAENEGYASIAEWELVKFNEYQAQ